MFRRAMNSVAGVDYVGTLTAAFVGAAGEAALLAREYGLSRTGIAASLLFLTGANYLVGRTLNKAVQSMVNSNVTLFTGKLTSLHMGSDGGTAVIEDGNSKLTARWR